MTGQHVNDVDAFILGFGQWMEDGLDEGLQLAILDVEAQLREAEFDALAIVLPYAEGGELRWPDVEGDPAEFRAAYRAAATLGWLGNDGADVDETPDPPAGGDSDQGAGDLPSPLGAWLDPETTSIEAHNLAATVHRAEADLLDAEWEALAVVLVHTEGGKLRWPVEPKDRADLFEALQTLNWLPSSPGRKR